ncbi:hypothetical protein [Chthonobacter albigriseus]|uniref:hypothetical protein n=1 Tax=Chthonobacter albigriseus TaxID=1683161 RepID=UPI0015EFC5E5|nr:hypothetical protein [Chthonobacter albigriseus]
MGNVVAFSSMIAQRHRQKPDRPCEITIFPGVRYERQEAVPVTAVASEAAVALRGDRLDTERR